MVIEEFFFTFLFAKTTRSLHTFEVFIMTFRYSFNITRFVIASLTNGRLWKEGRKVLSRLVSPLHTYSKCAIEQNKTTLASLNTGQCELYLLPYPSLPPASFSRSLEIKEKAWNPFELNEDPRFFLRQDTVLPSDQIRQWMRNGHSFLRVGRSCECDTVRCSPLAELCSKRHHTSEEDSGSRRAFFFRRAWTAGNFASRTNERWRGAGFVFYPATVRLHASHGREHFSLGGRLKIVAVVEVVDGERFDVGARAYVVEVVRTSGCRVVWSW